jgi:hypothetical protein
MARASLHDPSNPAALAEASLLVYLDMGNYYRPVSLGAQLIFFSLLALLNFFKEHIY